MEKFQVAYAMGKDWAYAVKDCCESLGYVPKPSAGMAWQGFLYATTHVAAEIGSILGYIRK